MNKIVLISLGTVGVGGTIVGGAAIFKRRGDTKVSIKEKYTNSILKLNSDETIWNSKYLLLKEEKENPVHNTLSDALSKSKEPNKESEARKLLKKGCEEIYDSVDEEKYLKDFKRFCAKNNKDVTTKTNWIAEDEKNTSWNTPLTALKSYSEALEEGLSSLKNKLPKDNDSFDDSMRKELKTWCDSTKEELFDGIMGSTKLVNQDKFCFSG